MLKLLIGLVLSVSFAVSEECYTINEVAGIESVMIVESINDHDIWLIEVDTNSSVFVEVDDINEWISVDSLTVGSEVVGVYDSVNDWELIGMKVK